jgi:phage terminase large subunit-like protein
MTEPLITASPYAATSTTNTFDPELPKRWTPVAQAKYLDQMRTSEHPQAWYCTRGRTCDGKPHGKYTYKHARADQWPPPMDEEWEHWIMASGRGAGKTRSGAEFVRTMTRYTGRIALIASTSADLRDVMIEGESGILRVCENAGFRPHWEPSKRKITFPNGAIATGYTAEEPDRLRGPQHGAGWLDEPAHWKNVEYVWDMYSYGLRLGTAPRTAITTTPTPIPWLKEIVAETGSRVISVPTFINQDNLAPRFIQRMRERYEGTRQGRQELYGEILTDVEGALWTDELLDATRVDRAPELTRIVIGVDPAGTSNKRSDLTGIVAVGLGVDGDVYILGDYSGRYTPHEWAGKVSDTYHRWGADAIVAEKNYGGEMVRTVLATELSDFARVIDVTSRQGKFIRAEPVFSLFEQQRAHLVGRMLGDLEDELTSWVPGKGKSPDRLDAMVHAAHELRGESGPVEISAPTGAMPRRSPLAGIDVALLDMLATTIRQTKTKEDVVAVP